MKETKELKKIEMPVKGNFPVTLAFGEVYQGSTHKGIDFGVPEGTPVYAVAAGTVLVSGFQAGGYGWHVILLHEDGSGSVYAHLCKKGLEPGMSVREGAIVGYSGNTGNSSGPHLHFEYRQTASYLSTTVNPADYFNINQSFSPVYAVPQSHAVPAGHNLINDLHVGAAEIVCDVANVRSKNMSVVGQINKGTKVTLTGDVIDYSGLKFYRSLVVQDVWIAANDGTTQILVNSKGK